MHDHEHFTASRVVSMAMSLYHLRGSFRHTCSNHLQVVEDEMSEPLQALLDSRVRTVEFSGGQVPENSCQ